MIDPVANKINDAVSKRRLELQAMSLEDVGREFQAAFEMHANLAAGKENLIERVLAKFRAELTRNS